MLSISLPYFNNPIGVAEWAQPNSTARIARISRTEYSLKASVTNLARPGMTPIGPYYNGFGLDEVGLPVKEVIQPHLPVRLPCYDFTPVISPAFGILLLERLE